MYTKKSLGQHFLRSERALDTIIRTGELSSGDTVLEIGPGEGVLTDRLLATGARVIAVEKDDVLYEQLKDKFAGNENVELVHADILEFESDKFNKIIANIPYNITGAILEKFLSSAHQPERMVLLVQKEVGERIVARDSKESILSISVKAYGEPRYIEKVLAGSFVPAPKVDSAIISIDHISKRFFSGFSETEFFKMLRAGFHAKRKKLSSNLAEIYPKDHVLEVFKELNLDENARAEDQKVEIWQKLAQKL